MGEVIWRIKVFDDVSGDAELGEALVVLVRRPLAVAELGAPLEGVTRRFQQLLDFSA
jgi:hypothetical protein